jgi:hypothetical protein
MDHLSPVEEDRRRFLKRAGAVVGATVWAAPTMQVVSMASASAQTVGSVVPPASSTSTSVPSKQLVRYWLRGEFESSVKSGSDPFWTQLENGTFEGTYYLLEGALPAVSGTSFSIPEFDIALLTNTGSVVIRYVSGGDFGGYFSDSHWPGSGDGFVFNNGPTQFQVTFTSGFDGRGTAFTGGVFNAIGVTPFGEIGIASGTGGVS